MVGEAFTCSSPSISGDGGSVGCAYFREKGDAHPNSDCVEVSDLAWAVMTHDGVHYIFVMLL